MYDVRYSAERGRQLALKARATDRKARDEPALRSSTRCGFIDSGALTSSICFENTVSQNTQPSDRIGPRPALAGRVEAIHVAPVQGAPMRTVLRIRAHVGEGLTGDRYALGRGHYSHDRRVSRDLTLIEAEVIEDLAALGIRLAPGEARRNVTTRGIRLNELVGRRFGLARSNAAALVCASRAPTWVNSWGSL
jgi:MOSC domain-containing protein YiiM